MTATLESEPIPIVINYEDWEEKTRWLKEDPQLNARVVQHAIRASIICASFDGRRGLTARALGPALALARYQNNIRGLLQANPGQNFEAQLAHKFLTYLGRLNGKFVARRKMFRDTRAYDKGPSTAERALSILKANNDIAIITAGRQELVRLILDHEPEQPEEHTEDAS
jgi:hypothetical protein